MSDSEAEPTGEIEVTVETEAVDLDGDGFIDVVEQTTITAYDVDGDGTPDIIESTTITGVDVDGDGLISEDEMTVESAVAIREDLLEEGDAPAEGDTPA